MKYQIRVRVANIAVLRLKFEDVRRVSITKKLGKVLGQSSPREYFSLVLYQENRPLFMKLVKEALPTVGFMCIYWFVHLVLRLRRISIMAV